MVNADEEALICDFAETYGIMDYRGLSPSRAAVLASGLRENSRIKTRLNGIQDMETVLMAAGVDALNFLAWTKTKNAEKGRNRPKSILQALTGSGEKEVKGFETGDDFMEARKKLMEEKTHGDRIG